MSADIIVSYDGTTNDDDALALGCALSAGGASLALAYVRHQREADPQREELAAYDAQRRLETGLVLLNDSELPTHVIMSASTDGGLERLAGEERAGLIVFGSDYRTPPGRAEPGNTAARLLEGGPIAIAVAQAGLRTRLGEPIQTIAVPGRQDDPAVMDTAEALASRLGAEIVDANGRPVDLIVVGSGPSGPEGRVTLSGSTRGELNSARGSVLVLARGRELAL
jgi:nucleotide-binding universal stress UspA family protein